MNIQLSDFHQKLYDEYVRYVWYLRVGLKTTIAVIQLHNGFEIVGSSACLKLEEYDFEKGAKLALERALDELAKYLAFDQAQYAATSVTNNYFNINHNIKADYVDSQKIVEDIIKTLKKSEWKVDF